MARRPIFQHRHYVRIAEIISGLPAGGTHALRGDVAEWFALQLVGTNPNYSRARFLAAAKGQPIDNRDER
jgi:hypothetical protein